MIRSFRYGPRLRAAGAGVVFIGTLALATIPGPFAQERVDLNAELYFALGTRSYHAGDMEATERYMRRSLALQPGRGEVHSYLGLVRVNQERWEEACAAFDAAVAAQPDWDEARRNLARARRAWADQLFRLGRQSEGADPAAALRSFSTAADLAPTWTEPLARVAWLRATTPVDSLRSGAEALRFADRALAAHGGDHPYLLLVRAAALAEVGRMAEAVGAAERGLELAEARSDDRLAVQLRAVLAGFRAGRPWRE
jgi:tetratricopeptide (TPR) repeat protein